MNDDTQEDIRMYIKGGSDMGYTTPLGCYGTLDDIDVHTRPEIGERFAHIWVVIHPLRSSLYSR